MKDSEKLPYTTASTHLLIGTTADLTWNSPKLFGVLGKRQKPSNESESMPELIQINLDDDDCDLNYDNYTKKKILTSEK